MKPVYLKSALKCDSFDVAIGIKILFFRVLVTIEPGRSLLQFVTTNCLINGAISENRKRTLYFIYLLFLVGQPARIDSTMPASAERSSNVCSSFIIVPKTHLVFYLFTYYYFFWFVNQQG